MNTRWQIRRTVMARSDGERRGDDAYQVLRHGATEHDAGLDPAPCSTGRRWYPRRRIPLEVALSVRVSTTRQQQAQTIAQPLERLHASVATHADWHLAEDHRYRDDGYRGATRNRPGLDPIRFS